MIVVTGAAGFIGSCLVKKLNDMGFNDLILVDDFSHESKAKNLVNKSFRTTIERNVFIDWFKNNAQEISFVYHIGARTDTTEFNKEIFDELNVNYSVDLWNICTIHQIPFVYASSAATYGNGDLGYNDDHSTIPQLQPLNPYGWSKQTFDCFVLEQTKTPPFWAGLKFFNVYGPNEFHKGRMASVIFHAFNSIQSSGSMKLFKSHRPDYEHGWQLRDFIYVKDLIAVCSFLFAKSAKNGIYNLGTGKARSFYDLGVATFNAMELPTNIEFIDMPIDIRDKYQYFTEASMEKLVQQGYSQPFMSLEEGVSDYVRNYLMKKAYF